MKPTEVVQFYSPDELAQHVAREWLQRVAAAASQDLPYSIALSGGRIALRLFASIVKESRARAQNLDRIEFFWADERCVPPDDAESNFGAAQNHLFGPLNIRRERIHRIRGEIDNEGAAAQAESEIRRILPVDGRQQPVLDMVFLGMGEDGHVASLFPDGPTETSGSTVVYRGIVGPKPPPLRVTISYLALVAARDVWVLASGAGKEAALQQSLSRESATPLGRVLSLRAQTKVFTDITI